MGDLIFHNHLEWLIEDSAYWNVRNRTRVLREQLVQATNRTLSPGIQLKTSIDKIGLTQLLVGETMVRALVELRGTMIVVVDGLSTAGISQ